MTIPVSAVGEAYRTNAGWTLLEDLVDIPNRMGGTPGEDEAIELVRTAFEDASLRDVSVQSFEIPSWRRGTASLAVGASDHVFTHQHEILGLPGTPPGDLTATLVDVGDGTPLEFESVDLDGQIALCSSATPDSHDRWIHRREKYDAAVDHGAVGFLFRNHVQGCLPPTGDISNPAGAGQIPAIGVSREVGSRLVRYCEDGEVEVTLSVECETTQATSGNVMGVLGPATEEEILVTAHHDAHDIAQGARDNGCGCAIVLTIAKLLATVEEELSQRVRFVTFGAEEIGLRGSTYYATESDRDNIQAVINCDAIGSTRDLGVYTNGFDTFEAIFDEVSEALSTPIRCRNELAPHSDHWPFVREGVPGVMAYSVEESDDRGWGHTHGDTLDKLEWRDLRTLAIPLAAGVYELATGAKAPNHVDREAIERRADSEGRKL